MLSFYYDHFLRGKDNKVKVYSTKPMAKPFTLKNSLLKKAYPYLIASVMAMSGGFAKGQNNVVDNDSITLNVSMQNLCTKSYLSEENINNLFNEDYNVTKDNNYNHMPENCNNFWDMVRSGITVTKEVQNSPNLSETQKKEYMITAKKMLSRIVGDNDNLDNVVLSDNNNLKTFLYFERVVKYKDDYNNVLKQRKGISDSRCEALGRYYKDTYSLQEVVNKNPVIGDFSRALYNDNSRYILSYEDSIKVNNESMLLAKDWIKRQKIEDDNFYFLSNVNEDAWCNSIAIWYNRGNDFETIIGVDAKGDCGDELYAPVGEILIHECTHFLQTKPSSNENPSENNPKNNMEIFFENPPSNNTEELGPTLTSLVINDYFYKKIHNIDQDEVVKYGEIDVNGKKIELGEIAVWFKGVLKEKVLSNQNPYSVDKILSEPDVYEKIIDFCKKDYDMMMNVYNNYKDR